MVFFLAVSELVAACQHDICGTLTIQVEGCRLTVGDVGIVEIHFVVGTAADGQRPVCRCAVHHVADALSLSVVGSDVLAVSHCDGDTILRLLRRITHVDGYLRGKLLVFDIVSLVKVGGVSHCCRLCSCLVDSYLEFTQLATG